MVLMRGKGEAGFCSALVLDSRTLLTAAHCLRPTRDMAVHYRNGSGAAVIIPVEATAAHPLYRPDAIRSRVESIDVALIRAASPLGAGFAGAALASGDGPPVGERVILSGYGAAAEGDWKSGGQLRSVTLSVREPASTVLSGRPTRTAGSQGPARAIQARRSFRPTAKPPSRSRPGRRRRTGAAAADSRRGRDSRRSEAGSSRRNRDSRAATRPVDDPQLAAISPEWTRPDRRAGRRAISGEGDERPGLRVRVVAAHDEIGGRVGADDIDRAAVSDCRRGDRVGGTEPAARRVAFGRAFRRSSRYTYWLCKFFLQKCRFRRQSH